MSPLVEMLVVIGGIGLALVSAIAVVAMRASRRRAEREARVTTEQSAQRQARRRHHEAREDAKNEARRVDEARRRSEEEACIASEREAQHLANEVRRLAEEEAHIAAKQEARRRSDEDAERLVDEALRHAKEEARIAAEHETRRRSEEEAQCLADEARRNAEEEARIAEQEARVRSEEYARFAAEQEAQRLADEARSHADEAARVATEQESQRKTDQASTSQDVACDASTQETHRHDEAVRRTDGPTRARDAELVTEPQRVIDETRVANQNEVQREVEEQARTTAQHDAQRQLDTSYAGDAGAESTASDSVSQQVKPPGTPRQYRPAPRVQPGPRTTATTAAERETRDRAIRIEVRLVFEKAGFCRVSLLPRRAPFMPAEFTVTGSAAPLDLLALQDEWYQDVIPTDIGDLLSGGIEWIGSTPDGRSARMSLSGRDIYVLARHGDLNGFVSAPRLVLGEEHVVLCTAERASEALDTIAMAESPEPKLLNQENGIPVGWMGLQGIVPRKATAPSTEGDILDVLRPLAEVDIALKGGIRIDRQTWLKGFPPRVTSVGDTSMIGVVSIDGHEATTAPDGGYVVPGWDLPGEHSVWCTSSSRRFTIRSGAEEWESWSAYAWSLGEQSDDRMPARPQVCGALIRPPSVARSDGRPFVIAESNRVLIGARPGDIEICAPRRDLRAGLCIGFPWFEPIWAVPTDALHSDKRIARVLHIGPPKSVTGIDRKPIARRERGSRQHVPARGARAWSTAILACSRKGLQIEPASTAASALWKAYNRNAESIRRAWR